MKAKERRKTIVKIIMSENEPVSGASLAKNLGVSRQIIVQDIAILKAEGYEILSTNRGYIISKLPLVERVFKVRHTSQETEDELSLVVGMGGTVADVFVWHKVYGKIVVNLNIFSQLGISRFIHEIKSGNSTELMHITDGYHYHTVRADSNEDLDKIEKALFEKNYIVPEK